MIDRVEKFYRLKLKPGERAVFDLDDIAQSIWIALREKDDRFDPSRGRYITFAARLVRHELCAIRESSRTVVSPRNTGCRLKEYATDEAAGTLTERKSATREAIRRSVASYDAIDGHDASGRDRESSDEFCREEQIRIAREAVAIGYAALTAIEVLAVSRLAKTNPPRISLIASETGIDTEILKAAHKSALDKIRRRLTEVGHIVVTMEQKRG
jgi:hypothetical protein